MKTPWVLGGLLAALAASGPAGASHNWIGLDLCRTYPQRMPPPLDPAVLPDPTGPGVRLLGRYCDRCHYAPGPGQHTAAEWAQVLARMEVLMETTARFGDRSRPILTPDPTERAALLAYLQGYALRPLADPTDAPPDYRALCDDCHAAPDPNAYAAARWPDLLARMTDHRQVMGRAPADPVAEALIAAYLGVSDGAAGGPGVAAGADAGLGGEWGRWLALGPIFALALLGLSRWWLSRGGRA